MRRTLVLSLLWLLPACEGRIPPSPTPAPRPKPEVASQFDPASTGSIAGTARWTGTVPQAEAFRSTTDPLSPRWPPPDARDWPNPNAPRIDPTTRALANAVVLLRGVDARKARPWDLPLARVEMHSQSFRIAQGASTGNIGFVRAGDKVDFISRDERLHVVQVRGSAFFSLGLPRPDHVRTRRLERSGVAEVLSGAGYFWMRAHLHVSDHPYLTLTGSDGRFQLPQVPAGEYDLVVWHPNWRVDRIERNPDLFRVQQIRFAPPLERVQRVRVRAGEVTSVQLELGEHPTGQARAK